MPSRKPRYFLVGGNKQKGLLPDITDDEINKLYKDMIKDDPDHRKFKGSKREYVQEVYIRIKTFLLLQEAFYNEKPGDVKTGGMRTEVEEEEEEEEEDDDDAAGLEEEAKLAAEALGSKYIHKKPSEGESKGDYTSRNLLKYLIEDASDEEKKTIDKLLNSPTQLYNILYRSDFTNKNKSEKTKETLRTLIINSPTSASDIKYAIEKFKIFADSFKEAIKTSTVPEDKRIQRNILNITMYPHISDWNHYGGLGTLQLRTFFGKAEDQAYITKLQGKYGEYLERSNIERMKRLGFIQDIYTEGKFLLRSSDVQDSDIFDLQQIEGNVIKALGEIKCFGDSYAPALQYKKMVILTQLYSWLHDGGKEPKIKGYTFDKKNFEDKTFPVIVYVADTDKLNTKVELLTTEVFPYRIEYSGFALIDEWKKTNNNNIEYIKLLKVKLNDNFQITDNRIRKDGKTSDKKIFEFKSLPTVKECIYSVTKTSEPSVKIKLNNKTFKTLDALVAKERKGDYPPFSKIPPSGFQSYNYSLPKPPKDKDAPYGLIDNLKTAVERLSKGEVKFIGRKQDIPNDTWADLTHRNSIGQNSAGIIAATTGVVDFETLVSQVKNKLDLPKLLLKKSKLILKDYLQYASTLILAKRADEVKRLKAWYESKSKK
jgi:hypothetical protein